MTAAPPFPVPRGMDWDPVKKRFFKRAPEKAKVEPRQSISSQETQKQNLQPPLPPSRFADSQSLVNVLSASRFKSVHSSSQQRRRIIIESNACHMKHVSTASIIPWGRRGLGSDAFWDWKIRIRNLHSTPHLDSMLCFDNGEGELFCLDTSHLDDQGNLSAISLRTSLSMSSQSNLDDPSQAANHLFSLKGYSDYLLPRKASSRPPLCSHNEEYLASYDGTQLQIGKAAKSESLLLRYNDIIDLKVIANEHPQHLCLRALPIEDRPMHEERLLLAYATQKQIGLIRLQCDYSSKRTRIKMAFKAMESDVMCMELLPLGDSLLVGLRNGTVLRYNTQSFLKRRSSSLKAKAAIQFVQLQPHERAFLSESVGHRLAAFGSGAVTHLQHISKDEVIVAYTSGDMFLIHPKTSGEPLVKYEGHINSWSLDLPMTIDVEHRLLAVAGQDCKVRIWSLDHPLPLHHKQSESTAKKEMLDPTNGRLSTKTLQETTFSTPISGLAFCQRSYIANLKARQQNMPRGLPALAVSCHGNQIAFFE